MLFILHDYLDFPMAIVKAVKHAPLIKITVLCIANLQDGCTLFPTMERYTGTQIDVPVPNSCNIIGLKLYVMWNRVYVSSSNVSLISET